MDARNEQQDVRAMVQRYAAIQREMRRLKEEKRMLGAKLGAHLVQEGRERMEIRLGRQAFRVIERPVASIECDEDEARRVLGNRYPQICRVSPWKVMSHIREAVPLLRPILDEVSVPHPDAVRRAVERGSVTWDELAGVVTVERKSMVTVQRVTRRDQEAQAA